MGYTILLQENGETVELNCELSESGAEGDILHPFTAEMLVPFNHRENFIKVFGKDGIKYLYGKKASDCTNMLYKGTIVLGIEKTKDIWEATAGNAGYFLNELLKWSKEFPNAVFRVY